MSLEVGCSLQRRDGDLLDELVVAEAGERSRARKASAVGQGDWRLFFLLRDADRFEGALRGLLPLSSRQSDLLIRRTVEVVNASVLGVLAMPENVRLPLASLMALMSIVE